MADLFPRDRQPRGDRRTTGDAAEDALLAGEPSRHRDCVVRAHDAMLVGDRGVPDRRADRRRHVLPSFDAVQGRVGLHRDDVDALRAERGRHADDRSGCAHAGDEVRDRPVGVPPDLGAGAELMRARVRWVGVLVDVRVALGVSSGAPLRLADRAVRPVERIREHERRPERARDPFALH